MSCSQVLLVRPRCSKYISVVYPQAEVYNLFGWDNYILWSNVRPLVPLQERSDSLRACVFILISRSLFQVRERTGIVHGWNLQTNATHQRAAIFLGSQQWGAAVATNSDISACPPPSPRIYAVDTHAPATMMTRQANRCW